jgi:hypothetical protein
MLAQRAVADSPRWTRAVEDQSAPIPREKTSELGGSIHIVRRAQSRIDQATLEIELGIEKMRAVKDGLPAPSHPPASWLLTKSASVRGRLRLRLRLR